MPILIKDNIATADRMQTSAGSPALVGALAPRDAFVVQRLRAAGAVLLGKANLSEWANIRGQHSISGWSSRGGQTLNPYALDRSPSGSSSGSGVAVAANLCAAAVGTETDGSITSPSSVNALVGVKPTVGALSRDGIVPISFSQDTPGPMCRTCATPRCCWPHGRRRRTRRATRASAKRLQAAALDTLDTRSLRGVRIGIASNIASTHRGVISLFDNAQAALKELGAEIVDAPIPHTDKMLGRRTRRAAARAEALDGVVPEGVRAQPGPEVAGRRDRLQPAAREAVLAVFGQELFEQAQAKGNLKSAAYRKARDDGLRYSRTLGIDAILRQKRLHALIAPTGEPAWLLDTVNGDIAGGASATSPPAVAGYPHVSVPMGFTGGLPVGLSFIGPAWSDLRLLQYAHAYEQATKLRQPPTYRASSVLRP